MELFPPHLKRELQNLKDREEAELKQRELARCTWKERERPFNTGGGANKIWGGAIFEGQGGGGFFSDPGGGVKLFFMPHRQTFSINVIKWLFL